LVLDGFAKREKIVDAEQIAENFND
jgi:hypothetical protein